MGMGTIHQDLKLFLVVIEEAMEVSMELKTAHFFGVLP